jgi:hypothetical protein
MEVAHEDGRVEVLHECRRDRRKSDPH